MAVQIGKALGMHVVGVAGPANTAWLTQPPPAGLGADEAVDYTSEDFAERYKDAPFDVVVDALSGAWRLSASNHACHSAPRRTTQAGAHTITLSHTQTQRPRRCPC